MARTDTAPTDAQLAVELGVIAGQLAGLAEALALRAVPAMAADTAMMTAATQRLETAAAMLNALAALRQAWIDQAAGPEYGGYFSGQVMLRCAAQLGDILIRAGTPA